MSWPSICLWRELFWLHFGRSSGFLCHPLDVSCSLTITIAVTIKSEIHQPLRKRQTGYDLVSHPVWRRVLASHYCILEAVIVGAVIAVFYLRSRAFMTRTSRELHYESLFTSAQRAFTQHCDNLYELQYHHHRSRYGRLCTRQSNQRRPEPENISPDDHNDDPRVKCPGTSRSLMGDPDLDWQFESAPQVTLSSSISGSAVAKHISV